MENTSSTARRKGAWADKNRSSLCDYNHFIDFINVDVLEHGPIDRWSLYPLPFIGTPCYQQNTVMVMLLCQSPSPVLKN